MSFEVDGFFSPEIDRFRAVVRTTEPFKTWFDYALDLNRIGLDLLKHATTPSTDRRLFAMYGHFVRAHHTFQGALILAERGMIPGGRIELRAGVESAISLHALANDPNFVDQMVEAHHFNQRKLARVVLDNPDYVATYSAAEVAEMRATIADVDAMEARIGKKLRDINWADVAAKHCTDLYHLLYRTLSSDGTHATINSLNRFVVADPATMQVTAFKVAPDTDGMIETLSAACLLFIWAAEPFAVVFERPDVSNEMSKLVQQFGQLPGAFPRAAGAAA
jgi:Family of unknown function (DUF5677)